MSRPLSLTIRDYADAVRRSSDALGRRVEAGENIAAHASALAQITAGLADAAMAAGAPEPAARSLVRLQLSSAAALIAAALDRLEAAEAAAKGSAPTWFGARFDEAFDHARGKGLNLVPLATLRAAFPDLDRAQFDAQLLELRRANLFVLHTHDGRHGRPTPEQLEATITEDGRTFVYAARRES